jgi:hypothetical protein
MSFAPFIVCDVCGAGAPLEFAEAVESEELGKGESFKIPVGWFMFGDGPSLDESDTVLHACPKDGCAEKLHAKAVS